MRNFRKPPVGARPGTLAISSQAVMCKVRVVTYDENTIEEHEPTDVEEIKRLAGSSRKLWVDVQGLGDEKLFHELAEIFAIHPLALEDVVNVPVRPKSEPYEDNLLVITQVLRLTGDRKIDCQQVSLFVGRRYVLTVQEGRLDVLEPVRQRLRVPKSRMRTKSSDYLGYAILDTVIDAWNPASEDVANRIDAIEERVLTDTSPEVLRDLNVIKSQLLLAKRAISPQREAVSRLVRDDNELVSEDVRMYLRDTHDHVVQISEGVENARELANGLINTYLSVISTRMNEVMKTLTIVASIFVPLTFMAGIYGMNFEHMPELQVDWAYPVLLAAMGITVAGMLVYFWRKGWIGSRK